MAKVKNPFIEALAKVAESQDISSFKKYLIILAQD